MKLGEPVVDLETGSVMVSSQSHSIPPSLFCILRKQVGLGWVGRARCPGEAGWKLPILLMYCLASESLVFTLCTFCSYIANQKRLEIINEDDVEAYAGLKNL